MNPFLKQVENLSRNLPVTLCTGNKSNEKCMIKKGAFVTTNVVTHHKMILIFSTLPNRIGAGFVGADADRLLQRHNENLAVADFSALGRFDNCFDR